MAIVIPSSKTYDRQNPKVRDNVIERIEVGAIEVVPNNEYETPVYNENIKSPNFNEEKKHNLKYEKYTYSEEDSAAEYEDYIGIYAGITAKYTNIDISIPKLSNNKLISNLLLKKDNESKIGINLICEVRYYLVTADYDMATNTISNIKRTENEQKKETKNSVNIQEIFSKQNGEKGYLYFSKSEKKYGVYGGTVSIETNIKDNNNILSTSYNDENESYEIKGLNILSGATGLGLSGHSADYGYIPLTGDEVDYTPIQVEITVYGNTIGIDLTDKTVYINGEAQKKVHSVDGNELMQTSNYLLDNGKNAIKTMYEETRKEYGVGKETATIRCSIGDYYDYNNKRLRINANQKIAKEKNISIIINKTDSFTYCMAKLNNTFNYELIINVLLLITENNDTKEKNISLVVPKEKNVSSAWGISFDKNSIVTVKNFNVEVLPMSFKLYDQVIPMVYGADGKDRPMSLYQDGTPKVFQVLGSKIYYDGAVWQELSLQEVDKSEVL